MARLARLVVPTHPHHVTQRGVRRMETFFSDEDYQAYISMVADVFACSRNRLIEMRLTQR